MANLIICSSTSLILNSFHHTPAPHLAIQTVDEICANLLGAIQEMTRFPL
jgi:hypothetical protein